MVGDSATAFRGDYALEVAGGTGGNASRSVQRGSVTFRAHQRVVPIRLVLGDAAARGWRATLRVTSPDGGYEEVAGSD